MSGSSGPPGQHNRTPPALSRRGFIRVVSVAGAAALGGCVRHVAPPHEVDTRNNPAQTADTRLRGKSFEKTVVTPVPPELQRATCVARIDNGRFATCDDQGTLKLWTISAHGNVAVQQEFHDHGGKKATFVAAAFPWVLTASYDGTVVVRNCTMANFFKRFTKHTAANTSSEVWCVAVKPDGTALSGTNDGQILQWNAALGDASPLTHYVDQNRDDPVAGLAFAPPAPSAPAQDRFLSSHGHGDVNLWTLGNGNQPAKTFSHRNSHHVNTVAVTGDGRFVSAGFDMTLRVWDLNDAAEHPNPLFPALKGHRSWIWRVAISPDNSKVASASRDGTVRLWDLGPDVPNNQRLLGTGPDPVGERGSMGVTFVNSRFLVYTTNHLDDPNDQVRVFPV